MAYTHQHDFPVVDEEQKMVGIFSDDDVRAYLYDDTLWNWAVARDIMLDNFLSLSPEDDLNTALRQFTSHNLDELPVLDPDQPGVLLARIMHVGRTEVVKPCRSFANRLQTP